MSTTMATAPTPAVHRKSRPCRSGTGIASLRMSSPAELANSPQCRNVAGVGMEPSSAVPPPKNQVTMTVSAPNMASTCAQNGARNCRASIAAPTTAATAKITSTAQVHLSKTVASGAVASSVAAPATRLIRCRGVIAHRPGVTVSAMRRPPG